MLYKKKVKSHLKTIYLRSSFNPGGTETLLLKLFNYNQSEIQFHYIFLKNGSLINQLKSKNNKYYCFFRKQKVDFSVLHKISRLIVSENIRIIHTHQPIELFYAVLLKFMIPKLHIFYTIHGQNTYKFDELLQRILVRFSKHIFAVSNFVLKMLEKGKYPMEKVSILFNACSPAPPASEKELEMFKKKYGIKSSDFIIGTIGNFRWVKDQLTIVKAYKQLRSKYRNLKLLFIGKDDNEYAKTCKTLINAEDSDRVIFTGILANASKYLSLINVFVMPSIFETFGIAVVEALVREVPVITSDINCFIELSDNGNFFQLFKTGDSNDLAEKIKNFILNKTQFTKKNRKKIAYKFIKDFSYQNYINKLLLFYNS